MRSIINTDELNKELVESPVDLLHGQMLRLSLKGKPFNTFTPASDDMIDTLWNKCTEIDQSQRKTLNFPPSIQHARNTSMMLQCEECDKWRLVFAIPVSVSPIIS